MAVVSYCRMSTALRARSATPLRRRFVRNQIADDEDAAAREAVDEREQALAASARRARDGERAISIMKFQMEIAEGRFRLRFFS